MLTLLEGCGSLSGEVIMVSITVISDKRGVTRSVLVYISAQKCS